MSETQTAGPNPPKKAKRGWRVLRFCLVVLALLLVLLLVAALLFPKQVNVDRVIRFFRYMGLKDKAGYGHVTFDAGSSNCYAAFDGGLLIAGEGGVVLYDMEGGQKCFIQSCLDSPILCAGEEVSACYSPGGSYLAAVGGGKILIDENLSGSIVDVDVSEDGYLSYITSESGYKSVATVLNKKQDAMYVLYSRTSYLNACAVSEKGGLLAVATLGEKRSVFHSGVTILQTDQAIDDLDADDSSVVRADLGNQVIYDLKFIDKKHLCVIGQNEISFLDQGGTVRSTVSLEGMTLLDYDVSGKGFVVLALEQNGSDSRKILVLDETGKTLASLEPSERVRSVSAEGKYIALLTDAELQIFDKKLDLYFSTTELKGAQRALARDDGTALLIGGSTASLFIP